jgi:hypothetical protein
MEGRGTCYNSVSSSKATMMDDGLSVAYCGLHVRRRMLRQYSFNRSGWQSERSDGIASRAGLRYMYSMHARGTPALLTHPSHTYR